MTSAMQADPNTPATAQALALTAKPRTVWRDAWNHLRHSKVAMISLAVLLVYVLVAAVGFTGALDNPGASYGSLIEREAGASNIPPALRDANGNTAISLWLGTDFLGRSVFWRVLYGTRVALTVATLACILSAVIGTVLGLISGFFGGWIDAMIVWLFSTLSSVPSILLMLTLAYVLKEYNIPLITSDGKPIPLAGVPTIIIALGLTSWVGLCRLIRGEAIRLRERDYVIAARAIGVSTPRILFRHILPNVFYLVIIDFTIGLSSFVQLEVILSFLGLGVADKPSWGRMIDDAKLELLKGVWWQMAAATVAIFVFSLAVNLFGDALRDALDPRLREAN